MQVSSNCHGFLACRSLYKLFRYPIILLPPSFGVKKINTELCYLQLYMIINLHVTKQSSFIAFWISRSKVLFTLSPLSPSPIGYCCTPSHTTATYLKAILSSVTTPRYSHILDPKHIHYGSVHKEHFTEITLDTTLKNFSSFRS